MLLSALRRILQAICGRSHSDSAIDAPVRADVVAESSPAPLATQPPQDAPGRVAFPDILTAADVAVSTHVATGPRLTQTVPTLPVVPEPVAPPEFSFEAPEWMYGDTLEARKARQHDGRFHPMTCINRGTPLHRTYATERGHSDHGILEATADGFYCPVCGWEQDMPIKSTAGVDAPNRNEIVPDHPPAAEPFPHENAGQPLFTV